MKFSEMQPFEREIYHVHRKSTNMEEDLGEKAFYKVIGRRIREARLKAEMSQEDLAGMLGLTNKSSVSAMENGTQKVSILQLYKIERALEVESFSLFPPRSPVKPAPRPLRLEFNDHTSEAIRREMLGSLGRLQSQDENL